MNKKKLLSNLALITAAVVWGMAFVSQEQAAKYIDTFTVNALRSLLAAIALIPLIVFTSKRKHEPVILNSSADRKLLLKAGFFCGTLLCLSSFLQQTGISVYPKDAAISARSGFITALYVIFVPIFTVFVKKKVGINVWISVIIATAGLYLLCGSEGISGIYMGDVLVLCCACSFALQILCVDHYIDKVDGVKLAAMQFFVCGVESLILMFIFENPQIDNILISLKYIAYLGLVSSGVGYTLQIIGQKYSDNPTVASILMSLESVFAALGGWWILGKSLSQLEKLGCVIMFCAIVLAQIPFKQKVKKHKEKSV